MPTDSIVSKNPATQLNNLETISTTELEQAAANLQIEGGLVEHKNRYGDNPLECPFLTSMGAAGLMLAEQLEKAQTNQNRGKTMAEIIAEKRARKATAEPTPKNPILEPAIETQPELLPQPIPETRSSQTIELYESLAKVLTIEPEAPDLIAELVEVPIAPLVLKQLEPLRIAEEEIVVVDIPVTHKAALPQLKPIGPTPVFLEQPEATPSTVATHAAVTIPKMNQKTIQEVTASIPKANEPTLIGPIEDQLITTSTEPALVMEAVALPEPAESVKVEVTEVAIEPIQTEIGRVEAPADELAIIETILQEWLTNETDIAEVLPETTAPPVETMLPIEPEIKLQVNQTLERIAVVLQEVTTKENLDPVIMAEELETLVSKVFELLGFTPQEEAIKTIVQEMVATSQLKMALVESESSLNTLNLNGTHEYKTILMVTLQNHFSNALQQRIERLKELSRYLLSLFTDSLAAPA